MEPTTDHNGQFTQRPDIGSFYRARNGAVHEVAAIWPRGIIFTGGPIVSATEFIQQFTPNAMQPTQGVLL